MPRLINNPVYGDDRCQNCGSPLRPGSMFCSECGCPNGDAPINAFHRCSNCRAILGEEDKYCQVCGMKAGKYFEPSHDELQCLYGPMPFDDDTFDGFN